MTKVPRLSKNAEDQLIARALEILARRLGKSRNLLNDPGVVVSYLQLKLARLENEVFGILFLDIQNKLIKDEVLFYGTLDHTAVYAREVVKKALRHNANSVILYHNHPSGDATPSGTDIVMTKTLKTSLLTVGIKLTDHIIVADINSFSFQHGGLL